MKQDERDKLNRAISEKRGEWGALFVSEPSGVKQAIDWCYDWRYAGKLLEEMPEPQVWLESSKGEPKQWGCTPDIMDDMSDVAVCAFAEIATEAIALAWARMNGVSYE